MQHRAFRLYLFVFSVQSPQCFFSRRRLLLFLLKDKKDTASIAVRKHPSLYMYASPIPLEQVMEKNKIIAIHTKRKDVHLTSLLQ